MMVDNHWDLLTTINNEPLWSVINHPQASKSSDWFTMAACKPQIHKHALWSEIEDRVGNNDSQWCHHEIMNNYLLLDYAQPIMDIVGDYYHCWQISSNQLWPTLSTTNPLLNIVHLLVNHWSIIGHSPLISIIGPRWTMGIWHLALWAQAIRESFPGPTMDTGWRIAKSWS